MMVHLVTPEHRCLYHDQLEHMHKLRWAIYVEERGWRALREKQAIPGYERDEYDDERAHYLLAIDDDGALLGAMRVRPADDRSLLADQFAHLVDRDFRREFDASVWELTRLLRAPQNRSRDGHVRFAMNCGLIEFCLTRDVTHLVATAETFLLPMTRKAWGPKVRPIGLPQPYAEGDVIALELTPDVDALAAMRIAGSITSSQLYEHPKPWQALDPDPVPAAHLFAALRASPNLRRQALATASSMEAA